MMHRHNLILICILLAACQRSKQEPQSSLARLTQAAEKETEATERKRPVFPYSIVEGGVFTPLELKLAKQKDPVVEKHYRNVKADALKPLRLTADTSAYVSYRVGNLVFWTADKINLKRGELVLSDGKNWVRGRCGNLISETPMFPTLTPARLEPKAAVFDKPTTMKAMTPYPGETQDAVAAERLDAPPVSLTDSLREKPNVALPVPQPGEQSWASSSSPSPGAIIPLGGAGGGGSSPSSASVSPASPGSSGTTPVAVNGYPPSPFVPPSSITSFWTNTLFANLPPYQSILMAISGPLPSAPAAIPDNINSSRAYITYWPQLTYLPQLQRPAGASYPLVSKNGLPVVTYTYPQGPEPSTDSGPVPPGSKPSTNPGSVQLPYYPPETSTPYLTRPRDSVPNVVTPEPETIVVTGISLLVLAGYYLLARIRPR